MIKPLFEHLTNCTLCPRACSVNREAGERGVCGMTCTPRVARASLHQWEEPPISGSNGSGTLFFSGCPMGCVYCQNKPISHGGVGHDVSVPSLAKSMMNLQKAGAHNLNLVTATHFLPSVLPAIDLARQMGFALPCLPLNPRSARSPETNSHLLF